MVSLSLIGFKLLSGQGFFAPSHCDLDFDQPTRKSKGIICQPWQTESPIIMSLSLIGFKLLREQGFYAPGQCDLDLLTRKPMGIICGPWPTRHQLSIS